MSEEELLVSTRALTGNRGKRKFDDLESKELGTYVDALRDSRDGKVLYIGQGNGNRILDHFVEAESALKVSRVASSKVLRILDICANDEDVHWTVLAYALGQDQVDVVESAAIDAGGLSQNGACLNEIAGPYSSMLTKQDIEVFGAPAINPSVAHERVFILPIQNGLSFGKSPYDATRSAWYVKSEFRTLPAYAVGVRNGISVGSYQICSWSFAGEKHGF